MNNDNHVIDRLPDFLAGSFDEEVRTVIQTHLQSCSACRQEYESLSSLWNSLGILPDEQPGPQLRVRFNAMLAAYQQGIRHGSSSVSILERFDSLIQTLWPRRPAFQIAIVLVALIVGGVVGTRLNRTEDQGSPPQTDREIAQLHGEVQAMSRMLAISLMQQQSASDRLKGVSMSSRLAERDPNVTKSLLDALRFDPSVNVRLAALDALSGAMDQTEVRKTMLDALPRQSSPLVQLAMVELVVDAREKESLGILNKMKNDPKVNIAVRKRIEQGIQLLL